jgi:hypothetical protein
MAENPGSRDRYLEALDFIINVLKEHEQALDKSIQELETVTNLRASSGISEAKVEKIEQKLEGLQKEVAKLVGSLSIAPKSPSTPLSQQDPTAKLTPAISPPIVQGTPSIVLNCKQWEDFQLLAMNSQTLFYSIKENDKVFQVEAVKGNQIITYTGGLPSFSLILRVWLSQQLNIVRQNLFEGLIEKGK